MKNTCINNNMIMDYIEDRLPEEEMVYIEDHIAKCNRCMIEYIEALDLLKDMADCTWEPASDQITASVLAHIEAQHPLTKLHRWIEKTIFPDISMQPGYALRRTSTDEQSTVESSFSKDIHDFQITIDVEKIEDSTVTIKVTIEKKDQDIHNVRVSLIGESSGKKSLLLKESVVVFNKFPFDSYTLEIKQHAEKVGEIYFRITDNGVEEIGT